MYGIGQLRDDAALIPMIEAVSVPEFKPKSGVKIDVTDAEAQARNNFAGKHVSPCARALYMMIYTYSG